MDIDQRLERIEKMCGKMVAMLAHIENEPMREALRKCKTPQEVKELVNAYKEIADAPQPDCPWK